MRLLFVPLSLLILVTPTQAGIFRKSNRPDPAVHVPALLEVLKSSPDDKTRAAAASELRDYDAKAFPDILPALIQTMSSDRSSSVRTEAADAIGKVRPISPQAGFALEQAIANDKDVRVRFAAQRALVKYRLLGYFGGGKGENASAQTSEPPFATGPGGRGAPGSTVLRPTPTPAPVGGPIMPGTARPTAVAVKAPVPTQSPTTANTQTVEPPLADAPPARITQSPPPPGPTDLTKPAPVGPAPLLTVQPRGPGPAIVIPPAAPKDPPATGPMLPPPKPLPSDLEKAAPKPAKPADDGPTLGPPPPKVP
ncbi:MAG TPA: HEAT repeat domain-containing protein [Gemmataceae bacterium]|nr:HEAT repeat domain-containing protein [Gemmataceae bacterium]